jgi:hypothetical protein
MGASPDGKQTRASDQSVGCRRLDQHWVLCDRPNADLLIPAPS